MLCFFPNCQRLQQRDLCQREGSGSGWTLKQVLCHNASAPHGENQALCAPLLGTQLHTQRYPRRIQDFPHILRLTRVLLQSKDLSMWFCLPLCMWVSGLGSNSVEIAPEKRSPRTTFPPGGKRSSQEAEQASLLRASRGSQLACVWKPLFGRNG